MFYNPTIETILIFLNALKVQNFVNSYHGFCIQMFFDNFLANFAKKISKKDIGKKFN
jgi:hypothetical protein